MSFNFPTVGELVQDYVANGQGPIPARGKGRRTSSVGRDWLGAALKPGDTVLSSAGARSDFFQVSKIFLDDSLGPIRADLSNFFFVPAGTDELYTHKPGRWSNDDEYYFQQVHPDWKPGYLGLIDGDGGFRRDYPQFQPVNFQGMAIQVKPLDGIGKARSLKQEQVTAMGNHVLDSQAILELRASQTIQLTDRILVLKRASDGKAYIR